ncbi:Fe-S protein [Microbacterium sp.]|uniref:Fe-S protein n=1 Tax=Microbacterium sp. TaxID=51671 RepID=UPI002810FFA8|nr:Fe-S protein [Microbacterium sp.]
MEALEILRHVLVFVHLIGFAVLFGSWAAEAYNRRVQVTRLMDLGVSIAGIAGLILALPWGTDHELNYVKLGIKLVVLTAIGILVERGLSRQRAGGAIPASAFWAIGVLTLLNAGIAVIWR